MGNLGGYQMMTMLAKQLGGPSKLLVTVAVGGYIVLRAGEGLVKTGYSKIKSFLERNDEIIVDWKRAYNILIDKTDESGLELKEGDRFVVLEQDNDALLIAIKDNEDNPYVVSREFIKSISDYKDETENNDDETERSSSNE